MSSGMMSLDRETPTPPDFHRQLSNWTLRAWERLRDPDLSIEDPLEKVAKRKEPQERCIDCKMSAKGLGWHFESEEPETLRHLLVDPGAEGLGQ